MLNLACLPAGQKLSLDDLRRSTHAGEIKALEEKWRKRNIEFYFDRYHD